MRFGLRWRIALLFVAAVVLVTAVSTAVAITSS